MKIKYLYFAWLLCSISLPVFSQDSAYIFNQGNAAQNAQAWINGKFTSSYLQTFRGTSAAGTRHHDFFGGTATSAGGNLRWSFNLTGTESGSNKGSDFKLVNYADNGTVLSTPLSIDRASGVVSINNNLLLNHQTANIISFNAVGLGAPTFNTHSPGSKINLFDSNLSATSAGYDIGIQTLHMWFGIPSAESARGFIYYAGETQVGRIDGLGSSEWKGQGRFKGWYTSGTGPATEIGYYNDRATIIGYDRTPATASYVPLYLAGGTSASAFKTVFITNTGVGINSGAAIPQSELSVNGTITAKRIRVTQTGWPDYVFAKDYVLPGLDKVEEFIKKNQHLEGIPAAAIVEKEGMDVGEMNKKLLEKVEELTLYLIEQNKKIKELEAWKKQQEQSQK
ncbi:hypothetical protein DVR12_08605 [Chitinophaga silvatica]|uniref:Chaperone of endosialidase n=1 Tax=Chitinophaga silvatica TaxID=2282649 RepID=A0A3E1YCA7_9BACT|nr:hypothetical protein [Chitinophaga silvatica]RFS23933.1 hypothetical protein DVR12_08605 [Chitinophaga silvatica]